jgi:predicted nicotinamide N-methyase
MSNHLNVGVQTWGSAILLGREIALHPTTFGLFRTDRPVRILELGAGTGLLSILCRKLLDLNVENGGMGGEVIATDFLNDVLDNLKVCVDLNEGEGVKIAKLDWSTFPDAMQKGLDSEDMRETVGEGFDLVLASDCVYDETHAEMIRDVASWVVRLPDPVSGDEGGTLVRLLQTVTQRSADSA